MTKTYVLKWVDYSRKYGLGYILSNQSSGALFNDRVKMIIESTEKESFKIIGNGVLKDVKYYFQNKADFENDE